MGVEGALVQMVSHGFISGAMFFASASCTTVHSRQIADYGGVVNTMPKFAAPFHAVRHGQQACRPRPGSSASSWSYWAPSFNFWDCLRRGLVDDRAPPTTLWDVQAVVFGDVGNHHVAELSDINKREFLILALLAPAPCGWDCIPQPFTEVMHASVNDLLHHVAISKIQ